MRKFQDNLVVRFSLASFVIMLCLAIGLVTYLSISLSHQIEDMETHSAQMAMHSAQMAAGAFDSMSPQDMQDMPGMAVMLVEASIEDNTGVGQDQRDAMTTDAMNPPSMLGTSAPSVEASDGGDQGLQSGMAMDAMDSSAATT